MAGRMADLLLYLSKIIYENELFTNNLSKEDMSELAGMSKDNVTRILKEFQQKGLIKVNGGIIDLINIPALQLINDKGSY